MSGENSFIEPIQADRLLGAFRVVSSIKDALVVVHGPVGCHWGINYIQRLSSSEPTNATLSALRERSVIFGGHEHLSKAIRLLFKRRKKKYLIVLSTNVPSIIGDDVEAIIEEVDPQLSYLVIDAGGYKGDMISGYNEALKRVFFWTEERKKEDLSVNIIGLQTDIPMGWANVCEIKRLLSGLGIKVNSVFPPSSVNEIKKASKASLNIVFSYGKGLAEKMEERFGIPYIFFDSYPYGICAAENFLRKIAELFNISEKKTDKLIKKEKEKVLKKIEHIRFYLHALYDIPVCISADYAQAKGLFLFLNNELGFCVKMLNIPEKNGFNSSHTLEQHIEKEDIRLIFGSEVEKKIAKKFNIPSIAFSYPILSEISLYPLPYMGFKGVLILIEKILAQLLNSI